MFGLWGGGERELPRPTEHVQDDDAEARHKAGRKKWIEGMHRAAPGVDWRAIERRNARRGSEAEPARTLAVHAGYAAANLTSVLGCVAPSAQRADRAL